MSRFRKSLGRPNDGLSKGYIGPVKKKKKETRNRKGSFQSLFLFLSSFILPPYCLFSLCVGQRPSIVFAGPTCACAALLVRYYIYFVGSWMDLLENAISIKILAKGSFCKCSSKKESKSAQLRVLIDFVGDLTKNVNVCCVLSSDSALPLTIHKRGFFCCHMLHSALYNKAIAFTDRSFATAASLL